MICIDSLSVIRLPKLDLHNHYGLRVRALSVIRLPKLDLHNHYGLRLRALTCSQSHKLDLWTFWACSLSHMPIFRAFQTSIFEIQICYHFLTPWRSKRTCGEMFINAEIDHLGD